MEGGDQILPFVKCFYGSPSTYPWEDEMGVTQSIPQGEGGEQGDPLMPMLFALGQHRALAVIQERMRPGEHVMAFLDNIYTACRPERLDDVHTAAEEELATEADIHVHHGKTQVWNRGGVEPSGMEEIARAARVVKPDAVVWRGDPLLPTSQQGVKVLGIPIGHTEYVRKFLERKTRKQEVLFHRIPSVNDTQAAFLLLTMCGATRANFWLRAVRPEDTEDYARRHDANVWTCFQEITGIAHAPATAHVLSTLSLAAGGLGLASAVRVRAAAHWASWADSLQMIKQRHPLTARLMVRQLEAHEPVGCFLSVLQCQRQLTDAGLVIPPWEELANTPPERVEEPEPSQPKMGWQQRASRKLEDRFINDTVWPALTDSARALVRSQHGPLASAPLTVLPTSKATRLDPQPFRFLLCRRLHLPLPLSMRTCQRGRQHDIFGHHRAACAVAGILGKRGYPLECAAAQVCREAGARVSTNILVRDLDLVAHNNLDGRRLEVIADGPTLWHGAQLAIDTTLVSPLRRDGSARARAADHDGAVLVEARRRKERTYPELSGEGGRARLVVLAAEVGGRWSGETAKFLAALADAKAQSCPFILQNRVKAAYVRRWSAVLACSAARAFTAPLPDRRPVAGWSGDTPSVHEVFG